MDRRDTSDVSEMEDIGSGHQVRHGSNGEDVTGRDHFSSPNLSN